MSKKRIIFMGTPNFAATILQHLLNSLSELNAEVVAVVTEPDKPCGRGCVPKMSEVKVLAEKLGIAVLQPVRIRNTEEIEKVLSYNPDCMVVAAYGQILPKELVGDSLPLKSINVHGSLLPKYRGACPVQAAILNGDKTTGVTIMLMDAGMDTGDILTQVEFAVDARETTDSLMRKMAEHGGPLLVSTLKDWFAGKLNPIKQNEAEVTATKMICKLDGQINWADDAEKIERMSRAYATWPGCYTFWNGKMLKVTEADVKDGAGTPGVVFLNEQNELAVYCGKGVLVIKRLQLEGKKETSASDFANGYSAIVGATLGS